MAAFSNEPPYLLEPLPPFEFDVELKVDEKGELLDESSFIVKSNTAIDPNGGPVTFEFNN